MDEFGMVDYFVLIGEKSTVLGLVWMSLSIIKRYYSVRAC